MTSFSPSSAPSVKPPDFLLLHTPHGHPVYVRNEAIDVVREAHADEAATGARTAIIVNSVTIPLAESLDDLAAMLS